MNGKNSSMVRALTVLVLLLSGCGMAGTRAASSTGLHAWLDQAPDGALIPLAPFTLTAHARNTERAGVESLEFLVNGVSLGSIPTDPSQALVSVDLDWEPPAIGEYTIQAVAHGGGALAYSATARVCVMADVQPRMDYGICDPALSIPPTPTPTPSSTSIPTATATATTPPTATSKPASPVPPALPGAIAGRVFFDNNADGVFDAGDEGQSAFKINLFQNSSCTGSPYLGTSPDSSGNYAFSNLPAGTWCLSLAFSGSAVLPGNPQKTSVASGNTTSVNFAIQPPE